MILGEYGVATWQIDFDYGKGGTRLVLMGTSLLLWLGEMIYLNSVEARDSVCSTQSVGLLSR